MRTCCAAALVALMMAGCSDRGRPDPAGPDSPVLLTVEVVEPRTSETVAAGSMVNVLVRGSERSRRLTGLGFVARNFSGNIKLDSVSVQFAAMSDTTHVFSFRVPPQLGTNTQIDIAGIAFGPSTQSLRSSPQSVIVIACPAGANWCR
jgi:hypothetical protein